MQVLSRSIEPLHDIADVVVAGWNDERLRCQLCVHRSGNDLEAADGAGADGDRRSSLDAAQLGSMDDYGSSGSMPLFVRYGQGNETVLSRSHGDLAGMHFPRSASSYHL